MPTRQHHHVPQFYLRRFNSKPRRINLHNIPSGRTVFDASIKHQCSKPDYYRNAEIENALAELEGRTKAAISALCDAEPFYDIETIRQFLAVQFLRTPQHAQLTELFHRKIRELIGDEATDVETKNTIRFDAVAPENIPVYNLLMTDHLTRSMADLRLTVVETQTEVFITSDNPVFKYNQYLENVHNHGTTGLAQTGIQIFLPLSPKHTLVIYDADVYDYVKKQQPTETDVESLNSLQVISANRNLYFNDQIEPVTIQQLAADYAHLRQDDAVVLDEFSSVQDPQRHLAVSYNQTPDIGLRLSFLSIKRKAERISISKRLQNTLRPPYRQPPPTRGGEAETFATRVARH